MLQFKINIIFVVIGIPNLLPVMGLTFLRRFCKTFLHRYLPEYTQSVLSSGRCAAFVWGAISKDGLGPLARIDGRFNASAYCDMIEKALLSVLDRPFPDGIYLLQHDRSPIHTARKVDELLEACSVHQLQWPPNRADMNPIENEWGLMKKTTFIAKSWQQHGRRIMARDQPRVRNAPGTSRDSGCTVRIYAMTFSASNCRRRKFQWTLIISH